MKQSAQGHKKCKSLLMGVHLCFCYSRKVVEKKEHVRFNIKCLKSLALTICLIFNVYLFFFLNQSIYFFG